MYLGYHTVEQVAVGAVVGTVAAWLWNVVYVLVSNTFAASSLNFQERCLILTHHLVLVVVLLQHGKRFMTKFCDSPVGVWLLMRDFSSCQYSVVEEYEAWRQHRRIAEKLA